MKSLLAALAFPLLAAPAFAHAASVGDCHIGAYRLADGAVVDVAPTDGDDLRWRSWDGSTGLLHRAADGTWSSSYGWTGRSDGRTVTFSACPGGEIGFGGAAGKRIDFDVTETTAPGRDVPLIGRLVMPKGTGKVPVVVLIHGAERDSARDFYALQRLLPAQGIGVFVYDKRGTGKSGGKYTQDYGVLADDAVAAMRQARKLAGPRAGRVGYQGGSQGGWVAPLAANRAPVDFVVVSFGLAVSAIEEDRQEIALEMKLAGHGPEDTAKALEVSSAVETMLVSDFTEGFDQFDAVRAKYRNEHWWKDLHGNVTRFLLPLSAEEIKQKSAIFRFGTPWHYDAMPVLRAGRTPQLWALGEDDLDAPSAETSRRIRLLEAEGKPITLAVFPHAEHGLTEYEIGADGERVSTRFAPGYFQMMADFIRDGRLKGVYGAATINRPRGAR